MRGKMILFRCIIIYILMIMLLLGCNRAKPTLLERYYGIANARALDNVGLVRGLERLYRSDTLLIQIGGCAKLNGVLCDGSAWSYFFANYNGDIEINYIWDVWDDGRIELSRSGPPIKSSNMKELGPWLKVNSDEAIKIAIRNGADKYIKRHPNAEVQMVYVFKGYTPVIDMQFYDPDMLGECEPQWWIRADTGEFLYTDAGKYCREE